VDWRLRFWDLLERRLVARLETKTSWIFHAAFAPNGRIFVCPRGGEGSDDAVQVWDVEARRLVRELPADQPPLGIAFSPDGKILAASGGRMYVADRPGELRLWDAANGTLLRPLLELPRWA
jgi:WD40 repeat protein